MGTSLFSSAMSKRKYVLLSVMIMLSVVNFCRYRGPIISEPAVILDSSKLKTLFTHFHGRHKDLVKYDVRSRAYDEILSQSSLYDFLRENSLEQRCDAYFQFLTLNDPEWSIDPNHDVAYSKDFDDYKLFKDKIGNDDNRVIEEAKKKGLPVPERHTEEQIQQKFEETKMHALDVERTLHDFLSHIRVFDRCFMKTHESDHSFVKKQKDFLNNEVSYTRNQQSDSARANLLSGEISASDAEKKIFPFLTFKYPVFRRWNGATAIFPGKDHPVQKTGSFLQDFKKRLNGRGIVMTLSDSHIEQACRLIRVLRAQGNKLPFQIFYHSKLSEQSQYELIKCARTDYHGYPTQDLWFVDISGSIENQYLSKFQGFANKIAACLFTSFEEYIFLDADAVVMKDLNYFFNDKRYLKTGTFFFKDRMIAQFRKASDIVVLKKMLPSLEDSIVFNIPQTSNLTMNNGLMQGLKHYMESGLVVINKKKHFMQPLMMSVMNFFGPIVDSFYGDKEHFWTSLALLGDENYAFNENPAAAIGELTPETERHKDVKKVQSFQSKELCSNHPAHISDDDQLLWFNSGFQYCGNTEKMNAEEEFKIGTRYSNLKTLEQFKAFFSSPLTIRYAVVPPPIIPFEKIKDNIENEPKVPWANTNYCNGYCWCAYSSLGGYYKEGDETKSNRREGRVIEFPQKQRDHFDRISRIWNEPLEN